MSFNKSSDGELPSYVAAVAAGYSSTTKRRLLAWCYILQRDHANTAEYGTFFLPTRKAAEKLGVITKDVAATWLNNFVRDGLGEGMPQVWRSENDRVGRDATANGTGGTVFAQCKAES